MDSDPTMEIEAADTPSAVDADEEDISELEDRYDAACRLSGGPDSDSTAKMEALKGLLNDDTSGSGPKATQFKERIVYDLTRLFSDAQDMGGVVELITTTTGYLAQLSKAKTAKVVRQVLDIVCAKSDATMQEQVAQSILKWCKEEKRSFLRQRVESKLAAIFFKQLRYVESLELCDQLLLELKKLDDKQLLVETHLLEAKIHFALHNLPKSKAALTASRTAANAIYVSPQLQADIDIMSGTIHTEESDYNTAHSYFLEAFEQLDQLNDGPQAVSALKYMMLCRILDSLRAALAGTGSAATTSAMVDLGGLLSSKQGIKYAGRDVAALQAIAAAATSRNLKEYEQVLQDYPELHQDLLIKHHLAVLQSNLLESNLLRVIEPYDCVELDFVAKSMDMPLVQIERKLSQMILDGKLQGILDQGAGHLIVYEKLAHDTAMEKGLQVIANMDDVVSALFARSRALRTMMM